MARGPVEAALGNAIAGKVLAGADDALEFVSLQALDVAAAHTGYQVGILAKGLLDASPARIAHHVQHRRQGMMRAYGLHLATDHLRHAFGQGRVPGAGHADDLGKHGGATGGKAGAAFLVDGGGDAQACLFLQKALDGVGQLGDLLRRPAGGAGRASDVPDAMLEQATRLLLAKDGLHRLIGHGRSLFFHGLGDELL